MLENIHKRAKESTGGAFGAGLVLVVLPSIALIAGQRIFSEKPMLGLPAMAILGIMILFGSLSLISTVFARLELANQAEALALPSGSIRAAIALSLIVLFAIISIMLYQSVAEPYPIKGLSQDQMEKFLSDPRNRVFAIVNEDCPAPCAPASQRYTVHVMRPQGQESTDLAKQLLILVGTLMASVTSFYFGSRTASENISSNPNGQENKITKEAVKKGNENENLGQKNSTEPQGQMSSDDKACCVGTENPTDDKDLPAATGGVQK